jgi:hypothetical protein
LLFFCDTERVQVKVNDNKPEETRNEDCGFFFHEGPYGQNRMKSDRINNTEGDSSDG